MQNEFYLIGFLGFFYIVAFISLFMMNRGRNRSMIKQKILERLVHGTARSNELKSMLNREGSPLSEKKFKSIMNELAWDGEITRQGEGWRIETIKRPQRVALRFSLTRK